MFDTMTQSRKWLILSFLVVAQFMIVLDVSIMNVALPSIERVFGLTENNLQWIVTAYTLCFGGFLLLGGRAADLFGRRRVFLFGIIGFTLVSLSIGLADSAALLVPLRALQGFFAAFMSPAALSIVLTVFDEPSLRARALSIWGAVAAGGATVGLLLGGVLTEYLSWQWDFFVNVPIGIVVMIAAWRLVPAHIKEEDSRSLDLPGALLATAGLIGLVFTLSNVTTWGWMSLETIGLFGLSVLLLVGFVFNERVARHPLVPLSIFRIGNIGAANLIQLPISASLFACFFFLTLYIQNVLHYTPVQAGLAFLPMSLTIGATAIMAPRITRHFGFRMVLIIAPLLLALGLFLLGNIRVDGSYYDILPSLLIMALALGATFVSIIIAATAGVPPRESGLASGIINTTQQIGGSIGLAILSSVSVAATATALASTSPVASDVALVAGFHAAFYTGAVFALTASVIAALYIHEQ